MALAIKSDKFVRFNKNMGDLFGATPVDLYGKQITIDKSESNLQAIGEDIKCFYGLEDDYGVGSC